MEINDDTLREFHIDFADAMLALENKYSIAIELGDIEYSPISFRAQLEAKNLNEDGEPMEEWE